MNNSQILEEIESSVIAHPKYMDGYWQYWLVPVQISPTGRLNSHTVVGNHKLLNVSIHRINSRDIVIDTIEDTFKWEFHPARSVHALAVLDRGNMDRFVCYVDLWGNRARISPQITIAVSAIKILDELQKRVDFRKLV